MRGRDEECDEERDEEVRRDSFEWEGLEVINGDEEEEGLLVCTVERAADIVASDSPGEVVE